MAMGGGIPMGGCAAMGGCTAMGGCMATGGRMVYDMYLMQVKTPQESKGDWDLYKVVATIPGAQAYTTRAETKCALWK